MKTVSIFVSSPGDVRQERQTADRVISRLKTELIEHVAVKAYFWEHEPMHAGADFQSQIPPPAQSDVFIGILWSRLGTRLHSLHTRPDGRPYQSGTEYEFENALEHYRVSATKTPRLLIYRRGETPLIPAEPREVFEERKRQWDSLQRFIEFWFTDLTDGGAFKAAFRVYRNTAEFEELLEEHLRKTICEIADIRDSELELSGGIWKEKGSPYRGFKAFDFEQAPVFFGRTRAIDAVVGQLRDQMTQGKPPFVLIFGASGSGKSSLLRAGVIPALVAGGIEQFTSWRRAIFQPSQSSGDLFEGLATAFCGPTAIPEIVEAGIGVGDLAAKLRSNPEGFEMYLAGTLQQLARQSHAAEKKRMAQESIKLRREGRANDADYVDRLLQAMRLPELRLILGLDQLEEVFVLEERFPASERKLFLDAIASLVRTKPSCVWIVGTLRSDYFSRCEESEHFVRLMDGNGRYRLLAPSGVELGQLIRHPAQAAGFRFEDDATKGRLDELLRDAALNEEGSLPLLELTLDRLFETANPTRQMTHEAYARLGGETGGLRGVLVKVADTCYATLSEKGKQSFPKVFKSLASLGFAADPAQRKRERFSKRTAAHDALRGVGLGAEEVIKQFVDARLLVLDTDDAGGSVVSVAHEALLNEWGFLRQFLEREIDFLRLRERFATAAAQWERDGRNPSRLARGLSLAEAREVRRVEPKGLKPFEADYIRLSARRRNLQLAAVFGVTALLVTIFAVLAVSASLSAREARQALSRSDVSRADEFFANGDSSAAMAFLARAVDEDPESTVAGDRLWFALSQRSWPIAVSPSAQVPTSEISVIAFSPDGKRIAVGSPDGAVRVWDTEAEEFLDTGPSGHKKVVLCCAFSPDGTLFITGSRDATARIWDAKNGRPVTGLLSHEDSVDCVTFSSDSRFAATGTRDRTICIWDVAQGKAIREPLKFDSEVNSIRFHPSVATQIVATFGNVARVLDIKTGEIVRSLDHPDVVTTAQFDARGDNVVTTSKDGFARLWSVRTGEAAKKSKSQSGPIDNALLSPALDRIATISGQDITLWSRDLSEPIILRHNSAVSCAAFSPDGSRLLSGTDDGKVRVWSAYSGRQVGETIDERDQVLGAFFTPAGRILVGTSTGLLRVWDSPALAPLGNPMPHGKAVQTIALSPDDKTLLTGAVDGNARVWDLSTSQLAGSPLLEGPPVVAAAFSADGKYFLTAAANHATLWETATRRKVAQTAETDGDVCYVAFSPEGKTIATATLNGEARFWAVPDCKPAGAIMRHSARITAILFEPHEHLFLTASWDGAIKSWDIQSGHSIGMLATGSELTSAALSPNRDLVAAGTSDGGLTIWDRKTGAKISPESMRHAKRVNACLFSPDGTGIASASDDGSAILWDVRTDLARFGALRHASESQSEPISQLAFSPDGKRLATGSNDGTVLVWDTASGRQLSERLSHRDSITAMVFADGGKLLVTAGNDGQVLSWNLGLPSTTAEARELAALARRLMPVQLNPQGRLEPKFPLTLPELTREFPGPGQSKASQLGFWLSRNPWGRPVSALSVEPLSNYIEILISEGSQDSLVDAAILASGNRALEQKVETARKNLHP
jgi:WD40 repeat protein